MIRAEHLSCAHQGRTVLSGVDLRLGPGTITGLLGPNGSGKTTLLSTLSGVLAPAAGRVLWTGPGEQCEVHSMAPRQRARRIACVPQRAETTFALRCSSVVLMGRYAHQGLLGRASDRDIAVAREALRLAGVPGLWDRPVDQISGGEFQRVLVARALAQEAEVLLLDEPTASMDMAGTVALFDLLRELADAGRAALVAVHDLNLAALYCDELHFLKDGVVAVSGKVEEVFDADTLTRIYGTRIQVAPHPGTGAPQAHWVPGASHMREVFNG
ncbi:ABC transporter ATP-binding protein [Desulfocurvus sp. DL9XJH121]